MPTGAPQGPRLAQAPAGGGHASAGQLRGGVAGGLGSQRPPEPAHGLSPWLLPPQWPVQMGSDVSGHSAQPLVPA